MNYKFTMAALAGSFCAMHAYAQETTTTVDWDAQQAENHALCDTDNDNFLSYFENRACLPQIWGQEFSDAESAKIWRWMDISEDGRIGTDESYMIAKRSATLPQTGLDDPDVIFEWLDDNADGIISWNEYKSAWLVLFSYMTYEQMQMTFSVNDVNSDKGLSHSELEDADRFGREFQNKYRAIDGNSDQLLQMSEWVLNPLFVPKSLSEQRIRERFSYYDANADGNVDFFELYHVIRATETRQTRLRELFSRFDLNGDGSTNATEALDALKEIVDPEMSLAQAEAFLSKYDKNADGRISLMDMIAVETAEWDAQREAQNAVLVWHTQFSQDFYVYDVDRDNKITWDEFWYVRALVQDEASAREMYEFYIEGSDPESVIQYDHAAWLQRELDGQKAQFDVVWRIIDSDYDRQISGADVEQSMASLNSLGYTEDEVWAQLSTADFGAEIMIQYIDACIVWMGISWPCTDYFEEITRLVTLKNETISGFNEDDVSGDGFLDSNELEIKQPGEAEEMLAWFDGNGDRMISLGEAIERYIDLDRVKSEAIALWTAMDPEGKGYVYTGQLRDIPYLASWIPADFLDGLDEYGDGRVYAKEACYKAGGVSWLCDELPEAPIDPTDPWVAYMCSNLEEIGFQEDGFLLAWYRIDRNQDEEVTLEELRTARDDATFNDAEVDAEFAFYNTDQEGNISYDEALGARQIFEQQTMPNEIWSVYCQIDTNRDGQVTPEEVEASSLLGEGEDLNQFDRDQDGVLSFVEVCAKQMQDTPGVCYDFEQVESIAPEEWLIGYYQTDVDRNERVTKEEFLATAIPQFGRYLDQDELLEEQFYPYITADPEAAQMTFNEALNKYNDIKGKMDSFFQFWKVPSPEWAETITGEDIVAHWTEIEPVVIVNGYDQEELINALNIDKDEVIEMGEACLVLTGLRANCYMLSPYEEDSLDWHADKNLDGHITYTEFSNALSHTAVAKRDLLWAMIVDGSQDPESVSWGHINEWEYRINAMGEEWSQFEADGEVIEGLMTLWNAQANFNWNDPQFEAADLNSDSMLSTYEFCMSKLGHDVICRQADDDYDFELMDSNGDGGLSVDELVLYHDGVEPETKMVLYHGLYDINNDGLVSREEVDVGKELDETVMGFSDSQEKIHSFFKGSESSDPISFTEFESPLKQVLMMASVDALDEAQVQAMIGSISQGKSEIDDYDLLLFMREVVQKGLISYQQDRNI